MDLLEKFENLLKSRYIFHLHTNYTDGSNSVEDYCLCASSNEFDAIIFTEHVRKELSYNFDSFLNDIQNAKQKYLSLNIWTGIESRIFPGGKLDIPERILSEIQVICFACHSFPNDVELYKESFERVFSDPRWKDHIRVWVHPGRFWRDFSLTKNHPYLLDGLISFAIEKGVFIEYSLEDRSLPPSIIERIPQLSLVRGLDAHSVESMKGLLGI